MNFDCGKRAMGVLLFDQWLPDNHCLEELV